MFVTIFKSGQMFLYTRITRSVAATHSTLYANPGFHFYGRTPIAILWRCVRNGSISSCRSCRPRHNRPWPQRIASALFHRRGWPEPSQTSHAHSWFSEETIDQEEENIGTWSRLVSWMHQWALFVTPGESAAWHNHARQGWERELIQFDWQSSIRHSIL